MGESLFVYKHALNKDIIFLLSLRERSRSLDFTTNYILDLYINYLMGDSLFVYKHALDKDIISLLSLRERVEV